MDDLVWITIVGLLLAVLFTIYTWRDQCWSFCREHRKRCQMPRGHLDPHYHYDHEWVRG